MPVLEFVFHAIKLDGSVNKETGLPLLHWRISAVTNIELNEQTGEHYGRCVALEMTSEDVTHPIALTVCVVESLRSCAIPYSYSLRSIKSTPYPWTKGAFTYRRLAMGPVGITVKALLELLLKDWEVYRFELVNKVSGCLHWSTTVLQKLCEVGIIQQDSLALCKEILVRARQSDVVWVPEDVRGRFVNPVLQDFPLVV